MATTVYSAPSVLFQDNVDSLIGTQTLQLWHSLGTEAGTDNSMTYWQNLAGTSYASHLLSLAGVSSAATAGHLDWDDGTFLVRFKWVTNSAPAIFSRLPARNSSGGGVLCWQDSANFHMEVGFADSGPVSSAFVPVNGTFYWMSLQMAGNTATGKLYTDSAGALGTLQVTLTFDASTGHSTVLAPRGCVGVADVSGNNVTIQFGGAFSGVCKFTGPAPANWSLGAGTGESAFCWSAARYTSYGRSLSIYNAAAGGQGWWNGPNFTIAAGTTYAAAAQGWALAGSNPTNWYLIIAFTGAGTTPAIDSQWHSMTWSNNTVPAGTQSLEAAAYGAGTYYFDDLIVISSAVDQSNALLYGSMTCKWNTFDFSLLDPATQPKLNDTIVMADPYWVGTVASVGTADPVDRVGHQVTTIAATNTNLALASPAPFLLSDAPDGSTSFGYSHLTIKNTQNSDGTTTAAGNCTTFKTGLWPAMTFYLASTNQLSNQVPDPGYEDETLTQTQTFWWLQTPSEFSLDTAAGTFHSGAKALKCTTTRTAAGWNAASPIVPGSVLGQSGYYFPVSPSGSYTFNFWGKAAAGSKQNHFKVTWWKDVGVTISTIRTTDFIMGGTDGPYAYTQISGTVTPPADAKYGLVDVMYGYWDGVTGSNGQSWFDDIVVRGPVNYTVRDVTVTWQGLQQPVYHVDFGDPIVTMSVWANSTAAGILPITSTKITDGAVTTPKLDAGSVTADKLAATLVLASMIQGGAGPAHTEMDANGFRAYDASGNLIINLPDDGSPAVINAQLVAQTLQATGKAIFQASGNEIGLGASLQLDSSITNPTQSPSLAQGLQAGITMAPDGTYDTSSSVWNRVGLDYDAAGGAGGATKVFWTCTNKSSGTNYALELKASDGTVNRSFSLGAASATTPYGICRLGSYVYTLYKGATGFQVDRHLQSNLSLVDALVPSMPVSGANAHPVICQDGTNIYIVDKEPGSFPIYAGNVKWNKYDAAMVKQGSTIDTGFSLSAFVVGGVAAGNFDFGAFRIAAVHTRDSAIYTFDSSGAQQANEKFFGCGNQVGLAYGDALATGARFWSQPGTNASGNQNYQHTTWTWTTASSKYWVGYTWYDSAGTVHETQISPRGAITMNRRGYLQITVPGQLPGSGGADDPNNFRFYMVPNASDPGATNFKLQATQTGGTLIATTYASGGAADPASNNFPAGTVAQLTSQAAGILLKGDGKAELTSDVKFSGGTSAGLSVTQINRKIPVLLSTITGGTTHNFTSIDGSFKDLEFRFMWRSSDAVNALENMSWRMNNISTATYYEQNFFGSGAAATSTENLAQTSFLIPAIPGGGTGQGVVIGEILVPNYTLVGTTGWTCHYFSWIGTATTNMREGVAGGFTNNNGPVTRVEFIPPTGFWGSAYTEMWGIP